ncbi:hypothetical protein AB834_02220 [PVC group bacterium (ex Bugula neritina AB1)]|nr:hypothetical protein AB834_02220 [PVC group bacterium (ex Bugula neritina AB1)]
MFKFEVEISDRGKDVLRLLFIFSSLLVFLSLISCNLDDIYWLTTENNNPSQNYIGIFGAFLAFYGKFLFGKAFWVLPFLLFCWAINCSKLNTYGELYKEFLGAFFVLLTLSAIFSMKQDSLSEFLFHGGLIGYQVANLFKLSFSYLGSTLILSVFLILSFALATEFFIMTAIFFLGGNFLKYSWKLLNKTFLILKRVFFEKELKISEEEETKNTYVLLEEDARVLKGDFDKEKDIEEPVEVPASKKPEKNQKSWLKMGTVKKKRNVAKKNYQNNFAGDELPPLDILEKVDSVQSSKGKEDVSKKAEALEQTLKNFDIQAEVVDISQGPVITVYEVQPSPGVKINRIVNLSNDIALALSAPSVRIVAPIPGKAVIGIEIPNQYPDKVFFRELIESDEFQTSKSKLSIVLGKDVSGEPVINALDAMPHLLIAGSTGAGKTVCLNSLIMSLLYKATPDEVKMIMIDPKMVEMTFYNGIPHLLTPVITHARKAADALVWAVSEMERRYEHFSDVGVRNIAGYHKRFSNSKKKTYTTKNNEEKHLEEMPYIVIIIDELADLMMTVAQDVETSICRLAQLSRAVGIHLVIATQRPSVNVLTGLIKSNLPCRISFRVASSIDSRTILDSKGGESLIGKGDMLFIPPGLSTTLRIQGCFLSDEEIRDVVGFLKEQRSPEFVNIFVPAQASQNVKERDEIYKEAVKIVIETQQASASFLQRRMRVGYNRAARLIEAMEEDGIISASNGSKPRNVLVEEYDSEVSEKEEIYVE